jgi:hypothetical protein
MRKWLIGIGVAVAAAALGVGAAFGGSRLMDTYRSERSQAIQSVRGSADETGVFQKSDANREMPCGARRPFGSSEGSKDRPKNNRERGMGTVTPEQEVEQP